MRTNTKKSDPGSDSEDDMNRQLMMMMAQQILLNQMRKQQLGQLEENQQVNTNTNTATEESTPQVTEANGMQEQVSQILPQVMFDQLVPNRDQEQQINQENQQIQLPPQQPFQRPQQQPPPLPQPANQPQIMSQLGIISSANQQPVQVSNMQMDNTQPQMEQSFPVRPQFQNQQQPFSGFNLEKVQEQQMQTPASVSTTSPQEHSMLSPQFQPILEQAAINFQNNNFGSNSNSNDQSLTPEQVKALAVAAGILNMSGGQGNLGSLTSALLQGKRRMIEDDEWTKGVVENDHHFRASVDEKVIIF